ncbi:hypothetical protein J518_4119 [Acinetobacter baumannii 1419130]|nr:hypothetical protein J518_4119 [Acinetobacter baumannii 1419130]
MVRGHGAPHAGASAIAHLAPSYAVAAPAPTVWARVHLALRSAGRGQTEHMNVPSWQHTKPLPQPTRHRMRGRTDFEDSLLSARREEQAKEKRRFQALTEALKARGIPSDPGVSGLNG